MRVFERTIQHLKVHNRLYRDRVQEGKVLGSDGEEGEEKAEEVNCGSKLGSPSQRSFQGSSELHHHVTDG